jgi:hypothetical protein
MTDWDDSIIAKTGGGKTMTTIETLVRLNGNEAVLEWIDPTAESDDAHDHSHDQDRSGGTE